MKGTLDDLTLLKVLVKVILDERSFPHLIAGIQSPLLSVLPSTVPSLLITSIQQAFYYNFFFAFLSRTGGQEATVLEGFFPYRNRTQ